MKKICVYCGSSPGARPEYAETARELGRLLGERGLGLVYGGARRGTMGEIADAVLEAGGEVIGVIPNGLVAMEVQHSGLTELFVVDTMHARKALMEELSDGFITLPGAYGTHDELFEILAWMQLGIHRKPVGILNVCGYFDELLAYLDKMVREGFLAAPNRGLSMVDTTPAGLLEQLTSWEAPGIPTWSS